MVSKSASGRVHSCPGGWRVADLRASSKEPALRSYWKLSLLLSLSTVALVVTNVLTLTNASFHSRAYELLRVPATFAMGDDALAKSPTETSRRSSRRCHEAAHNRARNANTCRDQSRGSNEPARFACEGLAGLEGGIGTDSDYAFTKDRRSHNRWPRRNVVTLAGKAVPFLGPR